MQREISWRVAVLCLGQAILFLGAMMLCVLAGAGWTAVACLGTLAAAGIGVSVTASRNRGVLCLAWAASVLAWAFFLGAVEGVYHLKWDHLTVAALVLAGVWLASAQVEREEGEGRWNAAGAKGGWRLLGLFWGLAGGGALLADGYLRNRFYESLFGAVAVLALLVACRMWVRLPGAAIQVVHTLILFLVGLPIADVLTEPSYQLDTSPDRGKHFYSFEAAQADPTAFVSWWHHFMGQWMELHHVIAAEDPTGNLRYRLRPNSEGRIFESQVRINSLGFRGPEIEEEKGEAYRIVAIGESTTFGCTIRKGGKPWPRVLEKLLNERLDLDRPVQVINAGVYGFTIAENVRRLKPKILPLDPDMIISYHGYNFFTALNEALPPVKGEGPPVYHERPLKLLADLEYQLELRWYRWNRQREGADPALAPAPEEVDPMETRYAEAYRELIALAREHGVRLVLGNYSMAVNAESPAEVIEFYRAGFPDVLESIRANEWHSEIVARLAAQNPGVVEVDTQARLDGKHQQYIDLMHFTQEGRNIMAETFFEKIRGVVVKEAGVEMDVVPTSGRKPQRTAEDNSPGHA